MREDDINVCNKIGENGYKLIESIYKKKKSTVNILTHCNAGWLATVDWGTALSPVFKAKQKNIPVHVWVDETRPRNQGFNLTAWELLNENIPNSLIVDNVGGHLMQKGLVDICITGTDRTSLNGDVCNKIGTYLKALAAYDNQIPFYVAAPISSIDFNITNGLKHIPIEERNADEVKIIDQRLLPHELALITLSSLPQVCFAIKEMQVRGAPLIGITAAYGMYIAAKENPNNQFLKQSGENLKSTRPTAVNLSWAVDLIMDKLIDIED
jgi:methylthioribose-1-phosphate isomerase